MYGYEKQDKKNSCGDEELLNNIKQFCFAGLDSYRSSKAGEALHEK